MTPSQATAERLSRLRCRLPEASADACIGLSIRIRSNRHMLCDHLEATTAALGRIPEAALYASRDPHDAPGRRIRVQKFLARIPQRDRNDVDASARALATGGHEVARQAGSRLESAEFGWRGQAAADHDEIEVHDIPFRGRRETMERYRRRVTDMLWPSRRTG